MLITWASCFEIAEPGLVCQPSEEDLQGPTVKGPLPAAISQRGSGAYVLRRLGRRSWSIFCFWADPGDDLSVCGVCGVCGGLEYDEDEDPPALEEWWLR